MTDLAILENFPGFYASFLAGIMHSGFLDRVHRDQLPPEPKNWREMQKHCYKEGFLEGVQREMQELASKKTFRHTRRPNGVQVIPLTWVFSPLSCDSEPVVRLL
jgi:hypothetical protein